MTGGITSIVLAPLVPWPVIAAIGALALLVVGLALFKRARGVVWRALALGILVLALLNPSLKQEEREPLSDIAIIVVDDSPSQTVGPRRDHAKAALDHLRKTLARFDDIEVRVLRVGGRAQAGAGAGDSAEVRAPEEGTRLFSALGRVLAEVPPQRLAGVIMITDGQVHDAPESAEELSFDGPLHVLLSGTRNARDRRLVIEQAPGYGIVGNRIQMVVRIEDMPGAAARPTARLFVSRDGGPRQGTDLPVGRKQTFEVEIEHGGPNIFELEVAPVEGELTLANNRAAVVVNGVRDRLRVLLVSGVPHAGERVWRNLLKADPSMDLVHFTILRPPEKQDGTPVRELSLIAFPTRELFEEKLDDFDLIIFDRYHRRGVLPSVYIENIVRYVRKGGAVLESGGPAFATALGLFRTPLGQLLPGAPTGKVIEKGYRVKVTKLGRRHPVVSNLPGSQAAPGGGAKQWGRWFRLIEADARGGMVLMEGAGNRPVLILDRAGEGRIAQFLTDHIWLWARGYEGGGPQAELLRRLAHWLMKEPELEENALRASVRENRLTITRRSLEPDGTPVTVRSPSGEEQTVRLTEQPDGRAIGTVAINALGLYRISDRGGKRVVYAIAGTLNPLEFADVRASASRLAPLVRARGGKVAWIADGSLPEVRRVRPGRDFSGRGWIGLKANRDYIVKGVREISLLPAILVLLLGLGGLMIAWRREGE